MGQEHKFSTTNDYKFEVNINLAHTTLAEHFDAMAHGHNHTHQHSENLVKALLGRDDITIKTGEGENAYFRFKDEIHLDSSALSIAKFAGVASDNLPPNTPEELTQELLTHLVTLHEAEHATQFAFSKDKETGEVDALSIKSAVERESIIVTDLIHLKRDIAKETDADLPVLTHLRDMEMDHVAQFWQDMRMTKSFIGNIPIISDESLVHDTASVSAYYEQTGEVLDLDTFITEKKTLLEKIHEEINFDVHDMTKVFESYPNIFKNNEVKSFLSSQEGADAMIIRPQNVRAAVENLLASGELEGLQKWEAQNYIDAMDRMGYEAEPNFDYEQQLRSIFEDKLGLTRVDPEAISRQPNNQESIDLNTETFEVNPEIIVAPINTEEDLPTAIQPSTMTLS